MFQKDRRHLKLATSKKLVWPGAVGLGLCCRSTLKLLDSLDWQLFLAKRLAHYGKDLKCAMRIKSLCAGEASESDFCQGQDSEYFLKEKFV